MKGHEGIIKLRIRGYKPSAVWLVDYPCRTEWEKFGDDPEVCVYGDNLNTLDLRYIIGLDVHISGENEERAKRLLDLCIQHRANKVIACANDWVDCYGYELID